MLEAGMASLVVVVIQVGSDDTAQGGVGGHAQLLVKFTLERMKERFHVGIVVHGFRAIHALHAAERGQLIAVRRCRVLDAAIGVEDQARPGPAPMDGLAKRAQRQADVAAAANSPGKDTSRMLVQDHCQVPPLIADLQVRHIADPHTIGCIGQNAELAIRDTGEEGFDPCARAIAISNRGAQPVFAHQAGHSFRANALAQRTQRAVNARTAVVTSVGGEDRANPIEQLRIALGPDTGWTPAPRIKAGARDRVDPAQRRDPVRFP